jgi:protein-L-isoaspartate(D-aspartate) O-methyltransferase
MAWRSSASTHAALCENLAAGKVISRGAALNALIAVDRAAFFPPGLPPSLVYQDAPYPIGHGATISAPHMHAACVEALKDRLVPGKRVLDVGSGTGILCAVFALLVGPTGRVVGVEHVEALVRASRASLAAVGEGGGAHVAAALSCVEVVCGDGRLGWPAGAPYDVIHVGAAAASLPRELVEQLAPG